MTHKAHERRRSGDGGLVRGALCLNGSAHAETTNIRARVDCPRCLRMLALMEDGMPFDQAISKVLDEA